MNTPTQSKINWTALIMALVGVAVAFDWLPARAEQHITELTLILGPILIATFRTWFTEKTDGAI